MFNSCLTNRVKNIIKKYLKLKILNNKIMCLQCHLGISDEMILEQLNDALDKCKNEFTKYNWFSFHNTCHSNSIFLFFEITSDKNGVELCFQLPLTFECVHIFSNALSDAFCLYCSCILEEMYPFTKFLKYSDGIWIVKTAGWIGALSTVWDKECITQIESLLIYLQS